MIIDSSLVLQEHRIQSLLSAAREQAQRGRGPVLVSVVQRAPVYDPIVFFERGAELADDRLFWSSPGAEIAIAGVDAAWRLVAEGPRRFEQAAESWRALCAEAVIDNRSDLPATGPILMGGFAFDPTRPSTELWQGYPDGLMVLPRYMLTCQDGESWLTINTLVWPDADLLSEVDIALRVADLFDGELDRSDFEPADGELRTEDVPPAEQWKELVRSLERDLRHGDLRKVVLARQCLVHGDRPFDPARALARLRDGYADCFIFAVAHGSRCFLGASPERLVRLSRGTVRATCLAGSIARGATPEQDRRLGEELLSSPKDRAEHAFVVRAISDALADAGVACAPLGAQTLMKLRNVQHLFTPVVGQAPGDLNILELVERLHPTPAVGGYPRAAALPVIAQRERLDRGWYAGPIGWMDARGDGEFAVAIRSALLRGAEAALFAGCGLVAGSDPEREYVESSLKLRPMLSVLGGSMS